VPAAYRRYLENHFREVFRLEGTPLRVEFRTDENPFAGRRNELTPRQVRKRQRLSTPEGWQALTPASRRGRAALITSLLTRYPLGLVQREGHRLPPWPWHSHARRRPPPRTSRLAAPRGWSTAAPVPRWCDRATGRRLRDWGQLNAAATMRCCCSPPGRPRRMRLPRPLTEPGWWESMIGEGRPSNQPLLRRVRELPRQPLRVVEPASMDPRTGRPYGISFPEIAVEDIAVAGRERCAPSASSASPPSSVLRSAA